MPEKDSKNTYSVKEMIEFIWSDIKEIKMKIDKQNGRVRNNEKKISWLIGGLAMLGIAIAIVRFF